MLSSGERHANERVSLRSQGYNLKKRINYDTDHEQEEMVSLQKMEMARRSDRDRDRRTGGDACNQHADTGTRGHVRGSPT